MTEAERLRDALGYAEAIEIYLGKTEGGELWDASRFVRETLEDIASRAKLKADAPGQEREPGIFS